MTHRVLVTGAAGAIGQITCQALRTAGHFVRGLDLAEAPHVDEAVVASIADAPAVREAMASMDSIVHLAAQPDEAPFVEKLLEPNVLGVHHVLEAAREHELRRVVLASSVQVVSGLLREGAGPVGVDVTGPRNNYAVTKILAEQWGRMYHTHHGLSVIAVRIGWLPRKPEVVDRIAGSDVGRRIYLGRGDAASFFRLCVEAEGVGYEVLYAASKADPPLLDPEPARRAIGYEARETFPQGLIFEHDGPQASAPR